MALTQNKLREDLQRLYREAAAETGASRSELQAASNMVEIMEGYVLALMDRCRADGDSWDEIGKAYGTTGQNAGRWFRRQGGRDRHPGVLKRAQRDRAWFFGDEQR